MKIYAVVAFVFFVLGAGVTFKLSAFFYTTDNKAGQWAQQTKAFSDEPRALADSACHSLEKKQWVSLAPSKNKVFVKKIDKKPTELSQDADANSFVHIAEDVNQYLLTGESLSASQWEKIKSTPNVSDFLLEQYDQAYDESQRKKLAVMMRNLPQSEKRILTNQLINGVYESDRRLAYSLIRKNPTAQLSDDVVESVVYNLYQESSAEALSDNLSVVRQITSDNVDTHSVISHVNQLTQHSDAQVRAQAIDTLSYINNSNETLGLVMQGLSDTSPKVRQAAASALFNYENINQNTYEKLIAISNDQSQDHRVREEVLAYLASNTQ